MVKYVIEHRIAGFQLILHPGSYIVEVMPENELVSFVNQTKELPDWIFYSKHAIWLSRENTSIFQRAERGDQFKRIILSRLQSQAAEAGMLSAPFA
ncbi:hypothetical protein L0222_05730 [bacterium]|nr:hypothetical protein [bacterium]